MVDVENSDARVHRFWDSYITCLADEGVKESVRRWYVKHVEGYLRANKRPLREQSATELEAFLRKHSRSSRLKDWQFHQLVHALQILFYTRLKLEWAKSFDWGYRKDLSSTLSPDHATLAREWGHPTFEWRGLSLFSRQAVA